MEFGFDWMQKNDIMTDDCLQEMRVELSFFLDFFTRVLSVSFSNTAAQAALIWCTLTWIFSVWFLPYSRFFFLGKSKIFHGLPVFFLNLSCLTQELDAVWVSLHFLIFNTFVLLVLCVQNTRKFIRICRQESIDIFSLAALCRKYGHSIPGWTCQCPRWYRKWRWLYWRHPWASYQAVCAW